jgi:hypothetical protein
VQYFIFISFLIIFFIIISFNVIFNYIILPVLMRIQNSTLISLDSGLFFTKLRDIPWCYTNLQWFTAYTANEGPARIQYKCLVPIYVCTVHVQPPFFQNRIIMFCLPIPMHSYIIYFQDRSVYFAAAKYVERSWEYINRSQPYECGNWD